MKLIVLFLTLIHFVLCSCSNSITESSYEPDPNLIPTNSITPSISSFILLQENNKDNLSFDIPCEIRENNTIECFARNRIEIKKLIVNIEFKGDSLALPNETITSSKKSLIDLNQASSVIVYHKANKRKYKVILYPYTGLPYISIETTDGKDIIDEVTFKDAYARIINNPNDPISSDFFRCTIRGHGNSTWEAPKKPYNLKFETKTSLFSLPRSKSWILVANHYDTTMIRNHIAHYISNLSQLNYTPRSQFVELILNGIHKGTYQLYEKIKVAKSRVNINDDDFLLEIENHPRNKDIYFSVKHLAEKVKIHSPDVSQGDSNYYYINNKMNFIDSILFSNEFLDKGKGYKNYIDIEALVEWYVITEITKNVSSKANWYMTYEKNGKLKMGPLWDYDLAFGNTPWGVEANIIHDFWVNSLPWFGRFLKDSTFVEKAYKRFEYFYSQKESIFNEIDITSQALKYSVIDNNTLWNVLDSNTNASEDVLKSYSSHVSKLKNWLEMRFEWIINHFNEEINTCYKAIVCK